MKVVVPAAATVAVVAVWSMVNSEALVPLMAMIGVPVKFSIADPRFSIVKVIGEDAFPETRLP